MEKPTVSLKTVLSNPANHKLGNKVRFGILNSKLLRGQIEL